MSEADVARARANVEAARARLIDSTQVLQARLKPSVLAADAWDAAKEKGEDVATGAVRAIGKRPVAASAAAIGVAALIARKPLVRLFGSLLGKRH